MPEQIMETLDPKIDGSSKDIVQENIEKLKEIFPEVFTEDKIDIHKLKEALGDYTDSKEERYNFTWHGKSMARRIAQTPSTGTLRPCKEESKDGDTTGNLFIEGDNLEVLKLLQKSYHKKIKMIYIDPPYNTGKEFIYPDNYKDNLDTYLRYTGQVDDEGYKFSSNTEQSGRYHTNWLNMMYPRLKLARNLLRDDGVIFISIDDNEAANLKKICDEIFGEDNFLGTIVWKKKTNGNNMGYVPPVHDFILCYAKIISDECLLGFPLEEDFIKQNYSNPDLDPRGLWTTSDLSANHKGPFFSIKNPNTGKVYNPPSGRYWVFNEIDVKKRIEDGRIIFGKTGKAGPVQKKFLSERDSTRIKAESWWDKHGMNSDGTEELKQILKKTKIFDHPKPSITIQHMINIATEKKDIIMDFFAGTAPTAHAVMKLNKQDGSTRKFIMVQLPEPCGEKSEAFKAGYKTIADIGKERIRRAGDKIVEENQDKEGIENLDIGFKVFKLDSSNIKPWDADFDNLEDALWDSIENIKKDRTQDDVLYELLLKFGLDLTLPIEERKIADKTIYVIGLGALVICLDSDITIDVVEGIGKLKQELEPEIMRVVFKDSGFKNDVVKTNAVQILRQHQIEDVKSL
ncbi:site-specific DNA-methyltransferase [Desulfobacula phenolica]|uniref:site-specific DNA-methyltransferase (adenine-specific) n=1 Tax=Desulfobacula phenolica TaxID=90732 RepID=A0A1H2JGR2_9BACT|nr:site-specific DNA-methyltransferase [Desulfobacula phenolica]SDU55338.1 adenine-specific DNA-methyltransferase [Desulfobacula phenolica]